jgi:chromatin remodeling complex protein RSC6
MVQVKSTSSKKGATPKNVASTTTPTPTPTPHVVESTTTAQEPIVVDGAPAENAWEERFKNVDATLKQIITMAKSLQGDIKRIQKDYTRQVKELTRKKNRRKNIRADGSPRPLSGFARPTEISDQLAKFLGEKKGTLLARTDVTKRITVYIKEHDLQNPENKRQIHADAPLRKLLGLSSADILTFFNLQKFMKVHFLKKDQAFAATVSAA